MHPWMIHPALVHFPIAFLTAAVAVDFWSWLRDPAAGARSATNLLVAGVVTGLITALAGLAAFFTVPAHTREAHELMYWHGGVNVIAMTIFAVLAVMRWRTPAVPSPGIRIFGAVALALVLFGGYLGGEIVYKGGAGVDPKILDPEVRHHTHTREHVPESEPAPTVPGPVERGT